MENENRDPEIEKSLGEIRKSVSDSHDAMRDQIDVSNEIDRLFLIYQAGGVIDQGKTNDILLLARASKQLDLRQFRDLAGKVAIVKKKFDQRKQSARYQAELWSILSDFTPDRDSNNRPIGSQELPDPSEVMPTTSSSAIGALLSTPISDMIRNSGYGEDTPDFQRMFRIEQIVGKLGLKFPNYGAANYTASKEQQFDTFDYYDSDPEKAAERLVNDPKYAGFTSASFPDLAPTMAEPSMADARQWIDRIRNLHEKRIADTAKERGASAAPPPFAPNQSHAKKYSEESIAALQKAQLTNTAVPQVGTPPGGRETLSGAPPVQQANDSSTQPGSTNGQPGDSGGMGWLDWLQLGLDGVGVVEPTPFADLTNAAISMIRAAMDPENAGQHMTNAGISLISTIPYAGDVAKLAKGYGKGGKALGNTFEKFAGSKVGKAAHGMFGGLPNNGIGGHAGDGGSSGNGGSGGGGGSNGGGGGLIPSDSDPIGKSTSWMSDKLKALGTLGVVVGSTIAAFKLLNEWVNKTAREGKELLESNRRFAQYSGEASSGYLLYDARETKRDIQESKYFGGSIANLARSQADLEDSQSEGNKPYVRTKNNIQATLNDLATGLKAVTNALDPLSNALKGFYAYVDSTKDVNREARNAVEQALREFNIENKPIPKLPAKEKK